MKRIMVMGVSAGAGKSTFAKCLGEYLGIDVYHLDALYWKPGWQEVRLEEFAASQREVVIQDEWIIEGNYSNTYDIRVQQADTIIYLEIPLVVCLYRVIKRWLLNRGKTRPDMGEGCKEKIEFEFIKFIVTTYRPRKKKMEARLRAFQNRDKTKTVIQLKGKRAIQSYLEHLKH